MGETSAPSDPEWMQCDTSGEPHTNLQLYLQCMTLRRKNQLLSLLLWRLPSRSYSNFCWYFTPVGGGCQQNERDLPWRAALLQEAPADTSQPGCQGAERWLQWTSPLSDDPMSYPFPFSAVSGDLGLETGFFPGRQGGREQSCRPAENHRGGSFRGCSHGRRNGVGPTFLLYAVYVNATYSKTLCRLSHHWPLHKVWTALNI